MLDLMVDLETFGQTPGCGLVSIGAVFFDPWSEALGSTFYTLVDRASCSEAGLFEETSTILWWSSQMDAAREAFDKSTAGGQGVATLPEALAMLSTFVGNEKVRVWGNGADFDNAVLAAAYRAAGVSPPWKFWNSRCYRTLKNLLPHIRMPARIGVHHNALDDAITQARHAQLLMSQLVTTVRDPAHPVKPQSTATVRDLYKDN